jgi:hypothetical protein
MNTGIMDYIIDCGGIFPVILLNLCYTIGLPVTFLNLPELKPFIEISAWYAALS